MGKNADISFEHEIQGHVRDYLSPYWNESSLTCHILHSWKLSRALSDLWPSRGGSEGDRHL